MLARIRQFLTEPHLGELEDAYRRYYLPTDIGILRMCIALSTLVYMVRIYQDAITLTPGALLYNRITLRMVEIAIGLLILWVLHRDLAPRSIDRIILVLIGSYLIQWILVSWMHPISDPTHFALSLVLLMALFIAFPTTQRNRLLVGEIFLVLNLLLLIRQPITTDTIGQALALCLAAIGSGLASIRLYTYRRLHFQTGQSLRQSAKENRTLRLNDTLTGVYNRRAFLQQAELEFNRSKRYNRALSLLILDLDHFKHINETYGNATGDIALVRFAATLQQNKRRADIFARLNGEEFGLLLPETPVSAAQWVAMRAVSLCHVLNITINGKRIPLSVSIGGTGLIPEDTSFDVLMQRAQGKLKAAKQRGAGQIEL